MIIILNFFTRYFQVVPRIHSLVKTRSLQFHPQHAQALAMVVCWAWPCICFELDCKNMLHSLNTIAQTSEKTQSIERES